MESNEDSSQNINDMSGKSQEKNRITIWPTQSCKMGTNKFPFSPNVAEQSGQWKGRSFSLHIQLASASANENKASVA
jgi:hypothetical protein